MKVAERWFVMAGIGLLGAIALAGLIVAIYAAWLFHDLPDASELADYLLSQVVGDLPGAGNVPGGHGHIFGTNVLDGWLAVAPPSEIPDEATLQQIRELLDEEYEG